MMGLGEFQLITLKEYSVEKINRKKTRPVIDQGLQFRVGRGALTWTSSMANPLDPEADTAK